MVFVFYALVASCGNYASAQTAVLIAHCHSHQHCSTQNDALDYASRKANVDNVDVVLVNTILNKTSIVEVRISNFEKSESSTDITDNEASAREVHIANTAGYRASVNLVKFLEDPTSSTLKESSEVSSSINGLPVVPLADFYSPPHLLNIKGASLLALNSQLESEVNTAFQAHKATLLSNLASSGEPVIYSAFKDVLASHINTALAERSIDQMQILMKASQAYEEAPWGLVVKFKKNAQSGLLTNVKGVALIDNEKLVFVLPVKDNGTVDTEALLGTEFRLSTKTDQSRLRAWFTALDLGISIEPCSSTHCVATVTALRHRSE